MILLQVYEGQGMECGNLNMIDLNKLIRYDTIRRCGFVGMNVAFLEEVCHCGCGLCSLLCSSYSQCYSLLPVAFCFVCLFVFQDRVSL